MHYSIYRTIKKPIKAQQIVEALKTKLRSVGRVQQSGELLEIVEFTKSLSEKTKLASVRFVVKERSIRTIIVVKFTRRNASTADLFITFLMIVVLILRVPLGYLIAMDSLADDVVLTTVEKELDSVVRDFS